MVYVLNREGKPLMPTIRYGRVRRLINAGLAVVVDYRPFTIQINYDTPNGVQEVSLGVEWPCRTAWPSATFKTKTPEFRPMRSSIPRGLGSPSWIYLS